MLEKCTPNSIADRFFKGAIITKPGADPGLISNVESWPLPGRGLSIAGTGDYDHSRSSGGSAAIKCEHMVVAKVSLGETQGNAMENARQTVRSIDHFRKVSPKTLVVVARADNGQPKPVVFQEQIEGQPLCKTPILKLLRLSTLREIKQIIQTMDEWRTANGTYDLCGQKTARNRLGNYIALIPFLSDNIMVDQSGKAWLTDNVLYQKEGAIPKKGLIGELKRVIKLTIPSVFIDVLIAARTTYDFVFKSGKSSAVEQAPFQSQT